MARVAASALRGRGRGAPSAQATLVRALALATATASSTATFGAWSSRQYIGEAARQLLRLRQLLRQLLRLRLRLLRSPQAMQSLVDERKANGPFTDVFDFARRTAGIGLNKRLLEHLIAAGALDSLEPDRAKLMGGIEILLGEASISQAEKETQQENLFGEADVSESTTLPPPLVPWSTMDRLSHEFNAIGFFLSGHPLDDYKLLLQRARVASFEDLESRVEKEVLVAGAVIKVDERKSKKGNPFAFITLSDATGQFEMTAFSEVLNGSREILQVGALVVASVTINREEGDLRLLVESLRPVDDVVANTEAGLRIFVEKPEACAGLRTRLEDVEQPKHKRGGEVSLVIMTPEREVEMRLPNKYAINPRIAGAIKAVPGVLHVEEV